MSGNYNHELTAMFAKGGFSRRPHGGHRDKSMLPDFLGSDCSISEYSHVPFPNNLPVSMELLGVFVPSAGYCKGRNFHCWSVRLANGLLVPAYSLGADYVVCQHTEFKCRQG